MGMKLHSLCSFRFLVFYAGVVCLSAGVYSEEGHAIDGKQRNKNIIALTIL